jgi:hypothetical protein
LVANLEGRQQKRLSNTNRHTFRPFWIIYSLFLETCTCDQATIDKGKAATIVLFFQIKEKLFKKWKRSAVYGKKNKGK